MPLHPFIPFPNVAQLAAIYISNGERCENVFYFQGGGAWSSTLLASLATQYATWESAHMAALRGNNSELLEVIAVDLTVEDGQWDVSATVVSGTLNSRQLPNDVTFAIKWITAQRGRSFRGRTYFIGLTDSQRNVADNNKIADASAAAIQTGYRAMLTTTWANGGVLVVASRRHNNAPRLVGVATPITDAVFTDTVFDNQRRRLPAHNVHR